MSVTTTLLQTKLYIPPPRPDQIARPQLIARFNNGLHRKLTLVSAPAGFGKSTLVSGWLRQLDRPAAWLSLDPEDNDPTQFFAYLAAAMRAIPHQERTLDSFVQGPQPLSLRSLSIAFLNDLASAEPSAFVLDDYHVISNAALHDEMAFVLDHVPPTCHLVITSRVDPLLPLSRLRARGEMAEIRTDDLRFSQQELAELLHARTNIPLSPQIIAALDTRTEGWIAGIHMAALSIQNLSSADEVARLMQDFAGSHRYVFDYLMDEVLSQSPPGTRNFLLQTSILDRFCSALCGAILMQSSDGSTDERSEGASVQAQTVLMELEQANLFIVPLDNERRWYRYHHLFHELLRQRLTETNAAIVPLLHERASRWYEENGDLETAFHYAHRGNHMELAARLLDAIAIPMITNSEITRCLNLVEQIPDTVRPNHIRLCLGHAWGRMFTGHYDLAELAVTQAATHLEQPESLPPDIPLPLLVAMIATLRAYIATRTSQLDAALRQSKVALHALDDPALTNLALSNEGYLRGSILLNLGITHHLVADDVHAAEQAYWTALPLNLAANNPFAVVANYNNFMRLRQSQGEFDEAIALGRAGLAWLGTQGRRHIPAEAEIRETLVTILYERNDLQSAAEHVRMLNGVDYHASPHTVPRSYLPIFLLRQARGDVEDANAILAQLEERVLRQEFPDLLDARVCVIQMKLVLWRLQPHNAQLLANIRHFVDTCGMHGEDAFNNRQEVGYATLAQALLVLGETSRALALNQRLCHRAEKAQRLWDLVRYQIAYALALNALDRHDQALTLLQQTISLAESMGAVRSFVDGGEPLYTLLRAAPSSPYGNRLLAAFGESIPAALSATEQNLIEPLSPRELEVLHLLAGGYANQEIADQLIVALATVKRHVSNIYGKLGVRNRTTAVARARELDLL